MFKYNGSASWRQALGDLFAGAVFTVVIALVVGGTTAMLLERSVIYA
ncbi:MAG: hypothetical protein ACRES3_07210 [Steroidobacteraceae bacterium]